ncbi:MAG: GAP family protein [Methanobacteriaceae archaeon]
MIILLLSLSTKPKTSGLGFLVGSLIVILIAVLLGFLAAEGESFATGGNPGLFHGLIEVILGLFLFIYAIKISFQKDNNPIKLENPPDERSRTSEFVGSMLLAMGMFAVNFITTILVIYASSTIAISSVNWPGKTISLILLVIITLLLVEIPLVICFLVPHKANKILSNLNAWIKKHGHFLTAGLLIVLGVYLIIKGLGILNWI